MAFTLSLSKLLKSEKNKRLFSNFISLLLIQGTNYVLPLITFPYLISKLGFAKFGILSFASAFTYYMQVFVDYGFNLSATRAISKHRKDQAFVNDIFSSVLTIKVILTLISFLVVSVLTKSVDAFSKDPAIFFLTFGMVISSALFPLWLFQGFEEMKYISRINISMKCLATVLIFLIIQEENDYIKVPIIYSVCLILASVIGLLFGTQKFNIKYTFPKFSDVEYHLKNSFHIFIAGFSGNLYGQGTVVILGFVATPQVVGFYATAEKIVKALSGLMQPVSQTLYPHISQMTAENQGIFLSQTRKYVFFISFIISISLNFLGKDLLSIFFNCKELEIITSLRLLSVVLFFTYMNMYFNVFLLALRLDNILSRLYLVVGISFLLFSYYLSLRYSLYGTCLSLLIVEVSIFMFSLYCLRKNQPNYLKPSYAIG